MSQSGRNRKATRWGSTVRMMVISVPPKILKFSIERNKTPTVHFPVLKQQAAQLKSIAQQLKKRLCTA